MMHYLITVVIDYCPARDFQGKYGILDWAPNKVVVYVARCVYCIVARCVSALVAFWHFNLRVSSPILGLVSFYTYNVSTYMFS